jgi:hypothetical protein
MTKALGLFSGGLDSILAALILQKQRVEVTGIAFATAFFDTDKAEKAAGLMGIPLIVRTIGEIHLEMVKNPRYGYGRNMNPCIDCHAMMFNFAGQIMEQQGFDFLFSGEVLGQRPMSQNRSALQAVAKHSGYSHSILRPLSACLLPVTPMEEQGLVDRSRLFDIQGRTRRRQKELATQWGLVDYPSSGGGCLLTEKSFSGRLRDLFAHQPEADVADVELLKLGRQFRISPRAKLTLGRNQSDNKAIKMVAKPSDVLLCAVNFAGPVGLVSGTPEPSDLATSCAILASYGKGQNQLQVDVLAKRHDSEKRITVRPLAREVSRQWIV